MGVVAAITPFNFPLNLVAHKVGPALAAGNTIVVKPAEETPLTAVLMAEAFADAGLPDGVLQLVHGDGPTTGEALVTHALPAKVSFTGSPPVGRRIMQVAGLKRVTLELGNNSGTIVEPDADLGKAVPRCVMSAFANAGQVCISLQRLYVHEAIAERFIAELVRQTQALKVGNPLDRDTDVGPLISDEAAERAEAWIRDAVSEGATMLAGGRREGRLLWPTVLTGTRPEMAVMCKEAFAPLVSVVTYRDFDEALRLLDDSPYGLQAGIYTRDIHKAFEAVRRLDVGGVMVNDTSIFRVDHMPYGGNRMSGIGREGVRFAVEEMTNLRMVAIDLG
jgi:acyl-CoA reductase-like NAD-dependent aldehyde dehydrogenase